MHPEKDNLVVNIMIYAHGYYAGGQKLKCRRDIDCSLALEHEEFMNITSDVSLKLHFQQLLHQNFGF